LEQVDNKSIQTKFQYVYWIYLFWVAELNFDQYGMKISAIKVMVNINSSLFVAFEWNLRRNKCMEVCYSSIILDNSKCQNKNGYKQFLKNLKFCSIINVQYVWCDVVFRMFSFCMCV
jgi:hypothetical protein